MWKKTFEHLAKFTEYFSAALLAIMVVVYFSQVIVRYVFNEGVVWAEELTTYCMLWGSYIALTSNNWEKNGHICVSIIEDVFPSSKIILYPIQQAIILSFGGFIAVYGMKAALFCIEMNQLTPNLRIPMGIVYMAIPVSCGLTCIISIYKFISYFSEKQWREPRERG